MGCEPKKDKCKTKINEKRNVTKKTEGIKKSPGKYKEKGRIQYFYHSPSSIYPIRDVLSEQIVGGKYVGHKTEPHIEIGAENWLSECYQPNIEEFHHSKEKYLFLITTCRNNEVNKKYGKGTNQFIVGYIIRDITDIDQGVYYVKGPTYIYSFDESLLVKDVFGYNFSRCELLSDEKRIVDYRKTKQILQYFKDKRDIREECVDKIIQLDKKNKKKNKTCQVLRGSNCEFQSECLRWNR